MRVYDIIAKKRDGLSLSADEIEFLISGYVKDTIPDYQIAAWLMAVYFQGMEEMEIINLTKQMVLSGDVIDLSEIEGIKVDKHSTGGVGDTTTLILGPIVAAAGIPVAKMSGRGLGHTGGTIDKLEAIPGFKVELTRDRFVSQVNKVKLAVVGQSGNIVPADKKLYALRDVTATVNSIPLIASSIMSKKIAAGADAIVLDVKTGSGAFLAKRDEAVQLAELMVKIGKAFNRNTIAVITNMDQPLGQAVGNALEVKEAILTLKMQGPDDLTQLCLELAAQMFVLAKKVPTYQAGFELAKELLNSGQALIKFKEFIEAQGGDKNVIDDFNLLPTASNKILVYSNKSGYVEGIESQEIGRAAMILGAGRSKKEDQIDLGVGIIIRKKVGDQVHDNEALAEVHYNERSKVQEAVTIIENAYTISNEKVNAPPLIYHTVK
jgi:pyrimidine-nucleoside phosphorylase